MKTVIHQNHASYALMDNTLTKLANRLAKTAALDNISPGTLPPITTPLAIAKCALLANTIHMPPREGAETAHKRNAQITAMQQREIVLLMSALRENMITRGRARSVVTANTKTRTTLKETLAPTAVPGVSAPVRRRLPFASMPRLL